MNSLRETAYFREAFQELQYSFGTFFLFETFVVAEIDKDVVFSWKDHAKPVVEEITQLYEQRGQDIVYISNRINPYFVVPSDWLHFFKHNYSLKAYGVVNSVPTGRRNSILEKIFMRSKMQTFHNLEDAILWAKELSGLPKVA